MMFGRGHTYTQEQQLDHLNRALSTTELTPEQVNRLDVMDACGKALGVHIIEQTGQSREQHTALTRLEECLMWARQAILMETD